MKALITSLFILLLIGCRTKKEVLKTEIRQSDTLIVKSEVIKAPVLNQSLLIEQICDSITGEVVKFRKVFVVDGDSIEILTNEKNQLYFSINQREREISRKDSIISKLRREISEIKNTTIYKKDWKWIFGAFFLGGAVVFLLMFFKPWKRVV